MSMRHFRFLLWFKGKKRVTGRKKIVIESATLKFKSPNQQGVITFVSPPSEKVFVKQNGIEHGVYRGSVQFQVAIGATDGTSITTALYTDSFNPSATMCTVDQLKPLRENDEQKVSIPAQMISFPYLATVLNGVVVINNPGQDDVLMA